MTTTDHTPADNQPCSRTARDDLEAMIRTDAGSMTVWSPAEALAALDAYRAEVEQALRDRDKYVAVPRWEYELMERQRDRAARAEAERATHRAAVLREAADELRDVADTVPELRPGLRMGAARLDRMADTAPAGAEDGQQ